MNLIKVALIGYGHLGKWHAEKIATHPSSHLYAVVDPMDSNLEVAAAKYPKVKLVKNLEEVIAQVDAVVIVSPTSTHFKLLKLVLAAGKHIFCEKPLCRNLIESKEILKLISTQQKCFMVGHSERFQPFWEEVDVINWPTTTFRRVTPFKGRAADVDVLQDLAIHDIDLVHYLFQEKIKSIETKVLKKEVTDFVDHAVFEGTLLSGKKFLIESHRNSDFEAREVVGQNCKVDLMNSKLIAMNEETTFEKRDHLYLEHESFYQAILANNPSLVKTNFQEGHDALSVIEAVYESFEQKKSVSVNYN
jgi:predicted dehydrogenase